MAKKNNDNENKKKSFIKELRSELKKVTWPTPKKLINNTFAVVAVVLIVATIVFVLDLCFENLNKFGVEGLKKIVSSESETVEDTVEDTENNVSTEGIELVPEEQVQETENIETENNQAEQVAE